MKRFLVALLLLFATPALAETHVITKDPGGEIVAFISKYVQWRDAGDSVRIEGACYSACTLVLGIIDPDKICATRNAEFGFHSASLVYPDHMEFTLEGTQLMWFFYQDRTRRVLVNHGWSEPSKHPEILMIDAEEFVKPCKWEDFHNDAVINKP